MRIDTGHVAVVTGGTSGIGFAIVDVLVRRGVNVMIADIREDAIPFAVDALAGKPGHAAGVRADLSVAADLDALADATVERSPPSSGSVASIWSTTTPAWCVNRRRRGSSDWRRGGG
jgi:NAD(P)-dependent dehydrogenase (short-subunit alcohol dehydrogenase family)